MSTVNGFQVGANVLKYSAEALENYNTPDYSSSSTYAVGDYVMYQGKLYKCKTAITTAEAWTAAHWDTAILSNDVSALKIAIQDVQTDLNNNLVIALEQGNLQITTTGWNEYSSDTRVHVDKDTPISLKSGDVIHLKDPANYRMFVGWRVGNAYKTGNTWLQRDWIVEEDGEYVFVVTSLPEATLTVGDAEKIIAVYIGGYVLSQSYYSDLKLKTTDADKQITITTDFIKYGDLINGAESSTNTLIRARTGYIKVPAGAVVTANTVAVAEYDKNKNFISQSGWINSYTVLHDGYIRVLEYVNNGNIRTINIKYPIAINDSYVLDSKEPTNPKWANRWLFDGAHRGSNRYIVPDTLPAYVNAKAEGYNAIEGDIRITSDGKYVIHHDDGMPSSSSYLISTHTLAELRANANMGYFNGEALSILELKEWLLLAKNLDMFVFAEFKTTLTNEQIIECMTIARDCGMQDRVAWMAELSNASVFRGFYPLCYLAIVNTLDYSSASQYVLAQHPERTFLYTGNTNITETLVTNCASVGLGVVGWCVSYSNYFGTNWTEEQVKTEIKRALNCGIKGMVIDYWTVADIWQETYSEYLLDN